MIVSHFKVSEGGSQLWDSAQQKQVLGHNITRATTSDGDAINFDGLDSHIDFGKSPLFYNPDFVIWADIVPGNKAGMQHIYGHLGRDNEDFWCNAQLTWDVVSGVLGFGVGDQNVFEISKAGFNSNQRFFIIGRCSNNILDLWVNGQKVSTGSIPRVMRPGPVFGVWAGQREYVRYGDRQPFAGKLFECGLAHDTSDAFINQLIQGNTQPPPAPEPTPEPSPTPTPTPVPPTSNNFWQAEELKALNMLFSIGTVGIYEDLNGNTTSCRMFIDKGWREEISRYESHTAELVTQISVLLFEVPRPQQNEKIILDTKKYQILSVDSEDNYISILNVKYVNS